MTQNAVVTKLLPNGQAVVAVLRGTACGGNCGGNCGSCEACAFDARILVQADNLIHASVGERVVITGKTSHILGAALLIYMLPLVFFFAAYFLAHSVGLGQGMCVLVSFLGLALGAAFMVFLGKRSRELRYEISAYLR